MPMFAPANERLALRRVAIVWGLLVLNAMTYYGSALHIPHKAGQVITQSALQAALIVALTLNRRVIVRPNVFLSLMSLLVIETIITALQPQHLGTVYRTFRLTEFVAVLWLISPWWGRRDLLFLRYHLTALSVVLGSVILSILVAPGYAFAGGRLGGALWAIPATQVAHYAALMVGLVILLWLSGHLRGRLTLIIVVVAGTILLLTHTRTALVALLAGLLLAGLNLITVRARARKIFAIAGVIAAITVMTLSSFIVTWLTRKQSATQLHDLSGRTKVWGPLLALPRDKFHIIFGFGLSNSSSPINGLPIDSTWFSAYQEEGLIGVIICAIILLSLLVAAHFQVDRVQRTLAIFLVTYCLIASFTETGFLDVSMYLLDLAVTASLITYSSVNRDPILNLSAVQRGLFSG